MGLIRLFAPQLSRSHPWPRRPSPQFRIWSASKLDLAEQCFKTWGRSTEVRGRSSVWPIDTNRTRNRYICRPRCVAAMFVLNLLYGYRSGWSNPLLHNILNVSSPFKGHVNLFFLGGRGWHFVRTGHNLTTVRLGTCKEHSRDASRTETAAEHCSNNPVSSNTSHFMTQSRHSPTLQVLQRKSEENWQLLLSGLYSF
jgi:hypothetical protein